MRSLAEERHKLGLRPQGLEKRKEQHTSLKLVQIY